MNPFARRKFKPPPPRQGMGWLLVEVEPQPEKKDENELDHKPTAGIEYRPNHGHVPEK